MKQSPISQRVEIDEFTKRFFEMEMEENLFFRFDPIEEPLWDVVRFEVFFELFNHFAGERHAEHRLNPALRHPFFTRLHVGAKNIQALSTDWLRLKRLKNVSFVALTASRYKDSSGNPVDCAIHDALQILGSKGSVQVIETQPGLHRGVNITSITTILARLKRLPSPHQDRALVLNNFLIEAQKARFGESVPHLARTVNHVYKTFLVQRQIWAEILERTAPRGIIITQNGIQKGLLYEARQRRIPVVECQHGVINLMHPAYSYPPSLPPGDHVALPNALLLFSEYWRRQCTMPGVQTIPVGNSSFYSQGVHSSRNGPAIFISAGVFHPYISPVAIEVARLMPDKRFLLKLHPSQVSERSAIEAEYRNLPNLSVAATEQSMPDLLADASDVIIIQSTAAYEALDRGVPVHVLKRPGYRSHADLFTRPEVHLVANAHELRAILFRQSTPAGNHPSYFQPFNLDAFSAALDEIGFHGAPTSRA